VLQLVRPRLIKLDRKSVSAAFQNVKDEQIGEIVRVADTVGARVVAQGIDSQENRNGSPVASRALRSKWAAPTYPAALICSMACPINSSMVRRS